MYETGGHPVDIIPDDAEGIGVHISYIRRDIMEIKDRLGKNYVTRDEFTPVRSIVYGMVGFILLAVVGGIVSFIIKK